MVASLLVYRLVFQSTLPVWGGTGRNLSIQPNSRYFNPPSPCGEGLRPTVQTAAYPNFNPPSPCGEGPAAKRYGLYCRMLFQSTLPVWGGTTKGRCFRWRGGISIHPPRVGRDFCHSPGERHGLNFNPPSPCGEGRQQQQRRVLRIAYFNPPSPCGEGPLNVGIEKPA